MLRKCARAEYLESWELGVVVEKMIPYFVLTLCSDTDADTDTYVACEIDETKHTNL